MRKQNTRRYKGNTLPYNATLISGQRLRGLPVRGPPIESGPLTGTALSITRREKKTTCTQLDQ
jgi:hypothetical protein